MRHVCAARNTTSATSACCGFFCSLRARATAFLDVIFKLAQWQSASARTHALATCIMQHATCNYMHTRRTINSDQSIPVRARLSDARNKTKKTNHSARDRIPALLPAGRRRERANAFYKHHHILERRTCERATHVIVCAVASRVKLALRVVFWLPGKHHLFISRRSTHADSNI